MDASSSQSVSDTESIFPEIPHQPRVFHFPKREFGKKSAVRRSFQTAWFDKWPWLHYREENDVLEGKVGEKAVMGCKC